MSTAAAGAQQQEQSGVLKVLTFTGTQPFVVRCERDTRVKDIVGAISEIWGFKEAARLFTLCRPAAGSDVTDPSNLVPGTVLAWNDRPWQAPAPTTAAGADGSSEAAAAGSAAPQPPPLLLVRYIFGTSSEWDQNHSVLSLTAAQIASDVAAGRYPAVPEAGLYQHWVKQGQHSVVLHMASSWPSGACLIVGPAQVLSGGAALQLGSLPFNLGVNSKGLHVMVSEQHKLLLPLESIASATPAGDVLNISFVTGQPDLLLQLPGAEAVAEAFSVHKDAAGPAIHQQQQQQPQGSMNPVANGSGPPSGQRATAPMPLWITSPSVERWLQEPTPKDDSQPVSVAIQVLRPWEQTPPVLRVLLTTEEPKPDDRLLEAQLLVVEGDDDDDGDDDNDAAAAAACGQEDGGAATTGEDASPDDQQGPRQPRIKLQLRVLEPPSSPPQPRVKLHIARVPEAEQELLMPAPEDMPLVRVVIRPRGERPGGSSSPLNVLRLLHKGAAAGVQQQGASGLAQGSGSSADGLMLRSSMLGLAGGDAADERPAPQLLQRLHQQQQQQQQEVRQGLLAGQHLGGSMGQAGFNQAPGMRLAYGNRPAFNAGYRPNLAPAGTMQQQGQPWGQQQYGMAMMSRPAGMRPLGGAGAVPHQPYALVGPPNTMMPQQPQQGMHRPNMGGPMQQMQARMRPAQPQQQQFARQMQPQQQFAGMRQPQQQVMMQPGGYMMVQQQQPQQAMMQQQAQVAYAAMPQQQQQQQPQQVIMMASNANTTAVGNNMVLVSTADGRQLLVPENQLQQAQAQQLQQLQQGHQQQVMSGVFVLGPHGELVPASQPAAAVDHNSGMQQMVLQQPHPQQQQSFMVAQQQGQPLFMQPTPSQKLQQQFQAQQAQHMQVYQQPQQQQQQRQVAGMGGLGTAGGYDQLNQLMGMTQPQLVQAQPMGFMDLNAGQMQLQGQQQQQPQQQQFVAVSGAQAGGVQAAQLLQLQNMAGTSASMGAGQQGLLLQQQQQQQPMQQQLLMSTAGQQQQQQQQHQMMLSGGATLMDGGGSMGLLQQQQQVPRRSNGGNMVMTGGATMFGASPSGGAGLVGGTGPSSSGGGIGGLGLLQQSAQGLSGVGGLADGSGLNNAGVGMGGLGGVGGLGGLGAPGSSFLNSSQFDALRQPNSHNSLDNTGLGVARGAVGAADPPGLNFGSGAQKQGGFLQQQQQQPQPQQQQMFTLGNANMGSMPGLGAQDGLQGSVLGGSDGYMLSNDGMTFTAGATGLDASGFAANQQLGTQPGYY